MPASTSTHFFLNWAKERIDEMDAALTSLEGKIPEVKADLRSKADKALADLRKKRDEFRDAVTWYRAVSASRSPAISVSPNPL